MSLGLDTNHGYAKRQVENSEAARSRAGLERKPTKVRRQAQAARERRERAEVRSRTLEKRLKTQCAETARTLAEHLQAWEQQGMWPFLVREKREAFQEEAAAKLAPLQQRKRKAEDAIVAAFAACERAGPRERDLLRQLEGLSASERAMYELDHAKDQTMTVLKLALVNLVMWTRDTYFSGTYAARPDRNILHVVGAFKLTNLLVNDNSPAYTCDSGTALAQNPLSQVRRNLMLIVNNDL
jgi:hypothetical protein